MPYQFHRAPKAILHGNIPPLSSTALLPSRSWKLSPSREYCTLLDAERSNHFGGGLFYGAHWYIGRVSCTAVPYRCAVIVRGAVPNISSSLVWCVQWWTRQSHVAGVFRSLQIILLPDVTKCMAKMAVKGRATCSLANSYWDEMLVVSC